jgi:cytosine/creatinine deaminase
MTANEPLTDAQARTFLPVALAEARAGLAEGGIPIGAALFHRDGTLLGRGHNRRVQDDDASTHAETAAFRDAGRRRHYADCIMVTTLSPCWYCSGLIRQFQIGAVVLDDRECVALLGSFIAERPELWDEDIGL